MLRLDFKRRAKGRGRLKGTVSRALRRLRKEHGKRVTLEDILDVWSEERGHRSLVGDFKQLFKYRHWLAHGRYWSQKSGIEPTEQSEPA